jgi:AhpD family alkylhydroperoxidase
VPHISLPPDAAPGISGLLVAYPDTGRPLREFVEVLLRGPSTLTQGERELIASSVSWWNDCRFCHASHGAAAAAFCMFNRYVDGLATSAPESNEAYRAIGQKMARHGYLTPYHPEGGDSPATSSHSPRG